MIVSSLFWPFLALIVGLSLAASPVPHQTSEESLRNALNAVTRKQRSLNSLPQDYYNELRSFKYHGDPNRKFDRDEMTDMDEEEDDLEFLPLDNGQLENIGGGFQNLNNKRLERALIDYLDTPAVQRSTASSLFRERERTGNHKRTLNSDRFNANDKDLARMFVEELQNSAPYAEDLDESEYQPTDISQPMYDRYRFEATNKLDPHGPMSWGNLFTKYQDKGDENLALSEEYRNVPVKVGGSYVMLSVPISRKNKDELRSGARHREMAKRFPVSKRSAKSLQTKPQVTDPKVAQDLGALFGTQAADTNKSRDNKDQKISDSHDHNDNHSHEQMDHNKMDHSHQHTSEASTIIPISTLRQEARKEHSTKVEKSKDRLLQIKKKSVDWSQYFGIDRRRKKATLLARPGTQEQDDEWLLQRYYKNMADNLKTPMRDMEKNGGEKRDKLDQMDEKLKNVKNLIVEDAVRYSTSDDEADPQEVKDVVMARLAAAYSLEKMRTALNEFRNSLAAQKDLQRASQAKNDNSSNENKEGSGNFASNEKRSNNMIEDEGLPFEGFDEGRVNSCPELEAIEMSCKPARNLVPSLFGPCVMYQICRSCDDEDECIGIYVMETARVCNSFDADDVREYRGNCAKNAIALLGSQTLSPGIGSSLCHGPAANSCLHHNHYRNRHFSYPYTRRHNNNNNNGFEIAMKR